MTEKLKRMKSKKNRLNEDFILFNTQSIKNGSTNLSMESKIEVEKKKSNENLDQLIMQ
jgi:hypothetical protein